MSECVVRMEMPTGCHWEDNEGNHDCPVSDYSGYCLLDPLDRNTKKYNGERPSWCPILCQLPEGHGDLVEAKEITVNVTIKGKKCSADVYATTIVPADTAERSET